MSMPDPDGMSDSTYEYFCKNKELLAFVKDLIVVMEKHGVTLFANYWENYDDETCTEEQGFTEMFSGCGQTLELGELRNIIERLTTGST
jgi:hypothetical protein